MDILTDERSWGGSGGARTPALGSGPGAAGSGRSGPRLMARGSSAGGAGAAEVSAWSYGVPGVAGGYWLAYRQPVGEGSGLSQGLPAGVALLALNVSRESLKLSVVDAPARRLARRLAEDSVRALTEDRTPLVASVFVSGPELRDAVASPAAAAPALLVPLGPQVQSAQAEVYSFLQASAGVSAQESPSANAAKALETPRGNLGGGAEQAPLSIPDPLLAVSLLPFLSLLILRSRLFS